MRKPIGPDEWIGVDFDGTLANYEHYEGPTSLGAPIPVMVERVRKWCAAGIKVKILTARAATGDWKQAVAVKMAIGTWLEDQGLPRLEVTCVKDRHMLELWDDRAVQVEMNTGRRVGYSTRGFDPFDA